MRALQLIAKHIQNNASSQSAFVRLIYNTKYYFLCALFSLLFLLQAGSLYAQKEYNIWYFGKHAGIDFNTSPPSPLLNNKLFSWEAASGICDANGNLLFYTNGDTVMNRLHQPMKNGILTPKYLIMSAVQGAIVVPVPGSCSKYFIFCSESIENRSINGYLRYSVVDMNGDGGLGEVIVSQKRLLPKPDESMALTLHSNGYDYWVAAMNRTTGEFNAIKTINGNIDSTIYRQSFQNLAVFSSYMKFSPNSKIMYEHNVPQAIAPSDSHYLNLFKFNNTTGKLQNHLRVPIINSFLWRHNAEFSPDSRFLYAIQSDPFGASYKFKIVQLDLSVWDSDSIAQSYKILYTGTPLLSGIQLAPDGKLYVFGRTLDKLSTIHFPNLKAPACDFQLNDFDLGGRSFHWGTPYYPTCKIVNISGLFQPNLGNDTILCVGESLNLRVNQFDSLCNKRILWNTGAVSKDIVVDKAGTYWVKIYNGKDSVSDTINIGFSKKFKVYLGPDTGFCGKFNHLLNAEVHAKKYTWSTGDTTVSILIDKPDWYSVVIRDSLNCAAGDTILVEQLHAPKIQLAYDSITCRFTYLSTNAINGISYKWNNGDTGTSISVDKKGYYRVTASTKFCSISTDTLVDTLPISTIDLGKDTTLCEEELTLNCNSGSQYLWSTGETTKSIKVNKKGTYWVTASAHGCKVSDTITINVDCYIMTFFIPNSFSPNNDNLNDVFEVSGTHFDNIEMRIFSRWGELLFEQEGKQVSWDGNYLSKTCQEGVYIYIISVYGKNKTTPVRKSISGNILLLR